MAKNWTVMVFMGANNIKGEKDLTSEADADVKEMESVGSGNLLDIVVQIDRPTGPERFYIEPGGGRKSFLLSAGSGSSGDGAVLREFLAWAQDAYPAEHYLLVIWGHAYRLAFGRDERDAMEFPKLARVLEQVHKVDVVGFDACGMSILEGAYQLRQRVDFLVASQVNVPLPGWPYDLILDPVAKDPDMDAKDLGALIVRRFVRNYREDSVTMTMLDLRFAPDMRLAVSRLADELVGAFRADQSEVDRVASIFQQCHVLEGQLAVDLATFCWYLSNYSGHEGVKRTAQVLGDLLINPEKPFVLEHGRSNLSVAMLQGVSIFAPNVEETAADDELRGRYEDLDLAKESRWGEVVFGLQS